MDFSTDKEVLQATTRYTRCSDVDLLVDFQLPAEEGIRMKLRPQVLALSNEMMRFSTTLTIPSRRVASCSLKFICGSGLVNINGGFATHSTIIVFTNTHSTPPQTCLASETTSSNRTYRTIPTTTSTKHAFYTIPGYTSSKDLLFFHVADGRRMTAKSKTKDLAFETQTCPAGWTVQVTHHSSELGTTKPSRCAFQH